LHLLGGCFAELEWISDDSLSYLSTCLGRFMRRGDIVRLRQAIQINADKIEEFTHGIIAARIKTKTEHGSEEPPIKKATVKELIIYLYDPDLVDGQNSGSKTV
jgi:hypothetical protein